jgi:hypothetical protein
MEINYRNRTSDPILVFASSEDHKRSSIVRSLPFLPKHLALARQYDMESEEFFNAFGDIIEYIKQGLNLGGFEYICYLGSDQCISVSDYEMKKHYYTISLVNPKKLTVSVNKASFDNPITIETGGDRPIGSVRMDFVESGKNEFQARISQVFQSMRMSKCKVNSASDMYYDSDPTRPDSDFDETLYMNIDPIPFHYFEVKVADLKDNTLEFYKKQAAIYSNKNADDSSFSTTALIIFIIAAIFIVVVMGVAIAGIVHYVNRDRPYGSR